MGYSFKYVTVPNRDSGQFAACFRGCAPFLAEVQRAEDAKRSEQIPMVLGAVQAVGERLVGEIAAEDPDRLPPQRRPWNVTRGGDQAWLPVEADQVPFHGSLR